MYVLCTYCDPASSPKPVIIAGTSVIFFEKFIEVCWYRSCNVFSSFFSIKLSLRAYTQWHRKCDSSRDVLHFLGLHQLQMGFKICGKSSFQGLPKRTPEKKKRKPPPRLDYWTRVLGSGHIYIYIYIFIYIGVRGWTRTGCDIPAWWDGVWLGREVLPLLPPPPSSSSP